MWKSTSYELQLLPNDVRLKILGNEEILRLSDCNWTRTQNHLVHKRTLDHLAKLMFTKPCLFEISLIK